MATNQLKKAMDWKARNISKAQDKKEKSIAFFNSVNAAISLVSGFGKPSIEINEIKQGIIFWRDWFFSEWEKQVVREEEQPEQETVEDVEGDEIPVIPLEQ